MRPRWRAVLERLHDGQRQYRARIGSGAGGRLRERGTTPPHRPPSWMEGADRPGYVEGQGDRATVLLLRDLETRGVRDPERLKVTSPRRSSRRRGGREPNSRSTRRMHPLFFFLKNATPPQYPTLPRPWPLPR